MSFPYAHRQWLDAGVAARDSAQPIPEPEPHRVPVPRSEQAALIALCSLATEILAELKRANSTSREGAVSSVEIKFLAPTKDHPEGKPQPVIKVYAGSVPPVDEAIEAYGRAFLMSQQAALEGWEQTVDVLQAERGTTALERVREGAGK